MPKKKVTSKARPKPAKPKPKCESGGWPMRLVIPTDTKHPSKGWEIA